MAKLKYTLIACVDCIAYVANGTIPEDRPELAQEIEDHMGMEPGDHLVNADGTDENGDYHKDSDGQEIDMDHAEYEAIREEWFSWCPCECCGSALGGNRNRLAVLCN